MHHCSLLHFSKMQQMGGWFIATGPYNVATPLEAFSLTYSASVRTAFTRPLLLKLLHHMK